MNRISLLVCFLLGIALHARAQAPAAPTLTSNSPVCAGTTLTITATATGVTSPSFTLTGPPAVSITNTTGTFSITSPTTANSGTYNVTVSDGTNTSAPATIAVVVNPVPVIAIGTKIAPTNCLPTTMDGSFEITGVPTGPNVDVRYTYAAAAVGPISRPVSGTGVVTVPNLSSGSYTNIRVTAAGCTSNSLTTSLNPPPPPTPAITVVTNPLCRDSTLVMRVTSPVTGTIYNWTGPASFAVTNQTIATRPNFVPAFNGTYSLTATVDGCVSAAATTTITMTPPSARPVRNNITYCQFDPAVPLTATTIAGYTVTWYDTAGGVLTPLASAPIPNTTVPKITMWLVRQTAPGSCPSDPDSVYARVLPRPNPPAVASNTISYCQYEVVGPLSVSGTNIRWFTTPTGGTGSTTAPTPATLVPGTYNFYASQTTNEGCESDRMQLTVIVKPKPEPPVVTSPLNLCQGDAPQPLTAIGQSLLWYGLPNGGVGVPVAPVISTNYEDSFFYYVSQTVNGCESDRALIASYIRYKPNGVITADTQSLCQDGVDTFFYYGNGRPDAEYVWFAPLSSTFISGQGTPGPVVIHFDTAGTSTVQLIVNNKGCISKLLAAPITVRPLPEVSFINQQDACEDELVQVGLTKIQADITAYQWEFGPDATIVYGETRTAGPFGIRYPRSGHYQVSVAATKDGCTSYPKLQDIFIHKRPDATISYAYRNGTPLDQFCASDTISLSVQSVPEGATYMWTPGAFFQDKRDTLNSEVRAVVNQSAYVHVKVTTAFGCQSDDSLYVPTKPCCGVYFPNAFTPASKIERNRIFKPITNGIHRINNFRVMNRWGQVVWESKGERNGWDGTYNGVAQDMGTYYFYINYRCENKNVEDQGEFVLIR
jgi:gliding motility-associated-like protein